MRKPYWTSEEIKILKEFKSKYDVHKDNRGQLDGLFKLLPNRSRKAINDKLSRLGICKLKGKQKSARAYKLKFKYGLTIEEYDEMFKRQNGLCAVCGKPETFCHQDTKVPTRLSVDHSHDTGKVRGLLCRKCNQLIGFADDNTNILLNAMTYLNGFKEN